MDVHKVKEKSTNDGKYYIMFMKKGGNVLYDDLVNKNQRCK